MAESLERNIVTRQEKINERLNQIPTSCRAVYRKAVRGKSLRAAVNAQCLECVGWQRVEVTNCTDTGCPLYAVRPYQNVSEGGPDAGEIDEESTNSSSRAPRAGSGRNRGLRGRFMGTEGSAE